MIIDIERFNKNSANRFIDINLVNNKHKGLIYIPDFSDSVLNELTKIYSFSEKPYIDRIVDHFKKRGEYLCFKNAYDNFFVAKTYRSIMSMEFNWCYLLGSDDTSFQSIKDVIMRLRAKDPILLVHFI